MADVSGEDNFSVFNLDEFGVNLSLALVPRPPGMWTQAQNGQKSSQFGLRGIEKRGGMATWHASALAGAVLAMEAVPLGSPFDVGITDRLIVGLREDTPLAGAYFKSSTDGTTWAGYSALTMPSVQWLAPFVRDESMYYVSQLVGDIAMQRWNGTTRYQTIDAFPDYADGRVYAMTYQGGLIYVVVNEDSAPAAGDIYRVYSISPENGVVTKIGDDTMTHALLGTPVGIQYTGGRLMVSGKGPGLNSGVVYAYNAGTWGISLGPLSRELYGGYNLHNCGVASLGGRMMVCYNGNGATIPGEVRQFLSGAWTTIFTCPNNDESVEGLAVHGTKLLESVHSTGNVSVRIYVDGVQELDVVGTYGATQCVPGASAVFSDGSLYWAWFRPGSALLQGFVLKRTAAGAWSQVDTGIASNGFLGMIGVA